MSRFFEGDEDELDFARVLTTEVSANTRCLTVQISASGDEGDNETDTERGDGVEVLQPLGLFAVPTITATTQAPFLRVGDQMLAQGVVDKGAAPQACETGGTKVYGAGGGNADAVVYIRADGSIEVTANANTSVTIVSGGTGDVVLQDGSQAFVRGTDFAADLTTFLTAVSTFAAAVNTISGALGAFDSAISAGVPAAPILIGTAQAALPAVTAALGVFTAAATAMQSAASALAGSATPAPSGWLSTRVSGQ